MKVKKEYIFLAIIIIGLSVYLFTRQKDRALYELPQLSSVAEKQITKIELQKNEDTIALIKKDEKWYIEPKEYLAASNKINDMTATISGLSLTALVSESEDYQRYELSDDQKITVRAWMGDTLARSFEVGKTAPSFQHTFVKLADDNRVYHARDNFRRNFDVSIDDLRDKQVLSFTAADIRQIKLTSAEGDLVLNRVKEPLNQNEGTNDSNAPSDTGQPESAVKARMVWQSADGRKVEASEVDRMLSTLAGLNCDAYLDEGQKADLKDPQYAIELQGAQTHTLKIYPKAKEGDEDYPAVSSQNEYPFTLAGWQSDSLMPKFSELVKEDPETRQTSQEDARKTGGEKKQ